MVAVAIFGAVQNLGVPPVIIHLHGIFNYKPSSHWGIPMTMEPPMAVVDMSGMAQPDMAPKSLVIDLQPLKKRGGDLLVDYFRGLYIF